MRFARRRLSDTLAIIFLVGWHLVYYLPVTLGQKVFVEGDIFWLHFPIRTELARALAEGRLPLWTPYIQAGLPLLAEGQAGALYPLNLLLHSLLPVATALSYVTLFNLAWASVGMYLLVRSCGLGVPGALLAGFVFGANGVMVARVSHSDVLTVASWLPWLMLFQQKYWQAKVDGQKTIHWFLLACFSIGLQFLGGAPQREAHNVATFALFGMFGPLLWSRQETTSAKDAIISAARWLPRATLTTASTVIVGIGIGAIQLLPTAELVGFSTRGPEMGKAFFTSFSLGPSALTQFIAPFEVLGQPSASNMEFWAYLGVLPILLALFAPWLRRDARTVLLALFALVSLSLALGGSNPLYDLFYYVPLINRFRVPARFLFLFAFAAALLAATAFEELQKHLREDCENKRILRAFGIVLALTTIGVVFLEYSQPLETWMQVWHWLPIGLMLVGIVVLLAAKQRWMSRPLWSAVVLGVAVLDLAAFSAPFLSTLARTTSPAELAQVPRTVQAMDSAQTVYRVFANRFPAVTQSAVRATLWTNLPLVYEKQGVNVRYNPLSLSLSRNEEFIQGMSLPMRNLMNIRYYLLPLETVPPGSPSPFDESEPAGGLTLNLLSQQPAIPPMRVTQITVTSYADRTQDLADGSLVGEIVLSLEDGQHRVLPIRLGIETADWAYDGLARLGEVKHTKSKDALSFPAYLSSVGHDFEGHKYVARYDLAAPLVVTAIGVRSFLPGSGLTIERIALLDEAGRATSLAGLLHRNDMALAFRSHTAAMWENQSVLPRAFVVHGAEIVDDDRALAWIKSPDFAPDRLVLLGDVQPSDLLPVNREGKASDEAVIAEYKSERVVLQVETDAPGYLVLTDSWYPGWTASVDGKTTPIYRADYIFRAVPLLPGQHSVTFEYRPASFIFGASISLMSLIACGTIAAIAYLRR